MDNYAVGKREKLDKQNLTKEETNRHGTLNVLDEFLGIQLEHGCSIRRWMGKGVAIMP